MQAKSKGKIIFTLSLLWAFVILLLGAWWMYLIFKIGSDGADLASDINFVRLIKWEGGTFLALLLLLSGTLFYQYLKDQKKTKSLQAFFATMTHEMKTPLASVRLQAEVISDTLTDKSQEIDGARIEKLATRLIEDTQKLETQMDKILQLSRLERGGELNPVKVNLGAFVAKTHRQWAKELDLNLVSDESEVLADVFALELILRNLFENTAVHTNDGKVDINISNGLLSYNDHGHFSGDASRLGDLFYKFDSSSGTGIGLYLVKGLMERMKGQLQIQTTPELKFDLHFAGEVTA